MGYNYLLLFFFIEVFCAWFSFKMMNGKDNQFYLGCVGLSFGFLLLGFWVGVNFK